MVRHAVHCFMVLGRDSSHHRDISVSECLSCWGKQTRASPVGLNNVIAIENWSLSWLIVPPLPALILRDRSNPWMGFSICKVMVSPLGSISNQALQKSGVAVLALQWNLFLFLIIDTKLCSSQKIQPKQVKCELPPNATKVTWHSPEDSPP